MNRLVIITDPVWKRLALESGHSGLFGLRYTLLKSGLLLEVHEIDQQGVDPESIFKALDGKERDIPVFSPGLSEFAGELNKWKFGKNSEESLPDPDKILPDKIIAFSYDCSMENAEEEEVNGRIVCISEDLSGAVRKAGIKAAEYIDKPAGTAQLFLVLTERSPRIDRYAEAFSEGWKERIPGSEVRRVDLNSRDETGETLREANVGSGDFVWLGGSGETDAVLSRLGEWGVPSCVTGSNAADAYPDTVKIEIRYGWEKALLAAASAALRTSAATDAGAGAASSTSQARENGSGGTRIKLEGVLRSYYTPEEELEK